MTGESTTTRVIDAPPAAVYDAFVDPVALAKWLAPDGMRGRVHDFDGRVGGGYRMSLFYAPETQGAPGKSGELEDRFLARFLELSPPHRLVQVVTFDSADPAFSGEMTMVTTLEPEGERTRVTLAFHGIPSGIRPEDNEAGTEQSLGKLARLLE